MTFGQWFLVVLVWIVATALLGVPDMVYWAGVVVILIMSVFYSPRKKPLPVPKSGDVAMVSCDRCNSKQERLTGIYGDFWLCDKCLHEEPNFNPPRPKKKPSKDDLL